MSNACVLRRNLDIRNRVVLSDAVKIPNNVSVYAGAVIEDNVLLGPSCVLTKATDARSEVNRHRLYETMLIRRGASFGVIGMDYVGRRESGA